MSETSISLQATYEGLNKDTANSLVQKSRPLQLLASTDLTLSEFKILDIYLSRINSHNPDKRTVILKKGELEQYLGVNRIRKEDLYQRLDNLFQTIRIEDERKERGFTLIGLFAKADANQDDNGLWEIHLTCTPEAMEYIFNIDNLGYLKYRLKNIVNLTSRYSYLLFIYLTNNRFRKQWTITLNDLKTTLNCKSDLYNEFKYFNKNILKKAQREIEEKTDLKFQYTPKRIGRKVCNIEFVIETLRDKLLDDLDMPCITKSNYTIMDESNSAINTTDKPEEWQTLELMSSACEDRFTEAEMNVLISLINLVNIPPNEQGIHIARYHYLNQVYKMLKVKEEQVKVYNPFAYLKKMIENDIEEL